MKKIFLSLLIVLSLVATRALAQNNYLASIGVKFNSFSLTGKYFIQPDNALEFQSSLFTPSPKVVVLYERNNNILGSLLDNRLKWYYGGGAHYIFCKNAPGMDVIVGLDYKLEKSPVNLSLEIGRAHV